MSDLKQDGLKDKTLEDHDSQEKIVDNIQNEPLQDNNNREDDQDEEVDLDEAEDLLKSQGINTEESKGQDQKYFVSSGKGKKVDQNEDEKETAKEDQPDAQKSPNRIYSSQSKREGQSDAHSVTGSNTDQNKHVGRAFIKKKLVQDLDEINDSEDDQGQSNEDEKSQVKRQEESKAQIQLSSKDLNDIDDEKDDTNEEVEEKQELRYGSYVYINFKNSNERDVRRLTTTYRTSHKANVLKNNDKIIEKNCVFRIIPPTQYSMQN